MEAIIDNQAVFESVLVPQKFLRFDSNSEILYVSLKSYVYTRLTVLPINQGLVVFL